MAKEIHYEEFDFTPEELDTLNRLIRTGTPIFLGPIEIENSDQFETLHITQAHCRTWRIGSEQVLVHLTPVDEATYVNSGARTPLARSFSTTITEK